MNHPTPDVEYSYEVREKLYADISLAYQFLRRAEQVVNAVPGPYDTLCELTENALAETDILYSQICKMTDRERLDINAPNIVNPPRS